MHIEKNRDRLLSFAAFFPLVVLMFQQIILGLNILPHEKIRFLGILFSGFPIIVSLYTIIERRKILLIKSLIIIAILILYTLVFFPENNEYLFSGLFYLLFINFPAFLCIASIKDISVLNKTMLVIANWIFLLGLIFVFLILDKKISFSVYSMSFSYYLLFPALIYLKQNKFQYYIGSFILLILMILFGSRGAPFITILYFLISRRLFLKTKFYYKFLILFISLIFWAIFDKILLVIENSFGIFSRTLSLFSHGELTYDSGRIKIYSMTWDSILDSPIWGHGLFGDRLLLSKFKKEVYVHNIFLELLHNYGLLVGSITVIMLIYVSIQTFKKSDKINRNFFLLFFSFGLIPLMFSGSYLINSWFGLFLGSIFLFSNKLSHE